MIGKYGLYIVWVLACLTTIADLYWTEPCCIDWLERICLYPLVFVAGLAAWRGFLGIASYLLPQITIGLCLAIYQIVLVKRPDWLLDFCIGCKQDTSSVMISGGVFLCITVLLIAISRLNTKREIP
jgi:disulfide bond formation protein DsbB